MIPALLILAGLMIAFQVLTMDEAIRPINYETLILLFGMMIVVANLRLSAFFVNDTMCLVLTPLVMDIAARLRRNLFSRISQGRHPPRRSFSSGR